MNQEFAENIKNHIREYLPVDYQDAKITLEKVTKGNDRILTGLIIRKDDETAVPSIYLEHYEEQFGKGRPMDDIMKNGFGGAVWNLKIFEGVEASAPQQAPGTGFRTSVPPVSL